MICTAQDELKRTTSIGKKMINAGKTNTTMRDTLEQIALLAVEEIRSGRLEWDNPRIREFMSIVEKCESELQVIENQVTTLKNTEFSTDSENSAPPKE